VPHDPDCVGKATAVTWQDLARLVRMPLVLTAFGDPVAGLYLAGERAPLPFFGVSLAAAFLYMGGLALNDLFDLDFDARHHPERVLPTGRVRPAQALAVGATCLVAGVTLATLVRLESGAAALALSTVILVYDGGLKRVPVAGDLAMGACRGLSVLLGAAAAEGFSPSVAVLAAAGVHTVTIAAVTGLSRLEEAERVSRKIVILRLLPAVVALAAVPVLVVAGPLPAMFPLLILGVRMGLGIAASPERLTRPEVARLVGIGVNGILLVDAAYLWGSGAWVLGAGVVLAYVAASRVRRS